MKILYLPLEFPRFYSARKFSYPLGIGMVEGFKNIEHITIPALYSIPLQLEYVKKIIGDQKFDQVWLEVVHSQMSDELLTFLTKIAPVRVGFVVESLTIANDEFISNPVGTQRRVDNTYQKLPYLTHVIVTDERDLTSCNKPTMLGIASVPERLIKTPSSTNDNAIFYGTLYGDRNDLIKNLEYMLNVNPPSAEDLTGLPPMFDKLFVGNYENYNAFFHDWYQIRQSLYSVWINHLNVLPGCAMLNPPHRTNVLSSRVIEGMAAGKPVVSPLMGNGVDDLFEDGKEIIYYNESFELLDCLITLATNSKLRFKIAEAARVNILENHTTEVRVEEILKFTGV
jgi:glycosyltransferase involved in cell wall biosynthesis